MTNKRELFQRIGYLFLSLLVINILNYLINPYPAFLNFTLIYNLCLLASIIIIVYNLVDSYLKADQQDNQQTKLELKLILSGFSFIILGASLALLSAAGYIETGWFVKADYPALGVFGFVSCLLYLTGRRFAKVYEQLRLHKENLEALVVERTNQLEAKNEKLETKNEKLETKNEKIMSSIRYAETIQGSILPPEEAIKQQLSEFFVFWQPTDIVGGDFYWYQEVADGYFLAVVDCTGHGVPGALMTMTANSSLNRIVTDQINNPAWILQELNRVLKTTLNQDQSVSKRQRLKQDDGLDIGLCYLPTAEDKLIYAGAGIDLFYTDKEELARIKADRQGIGYTRSKLDYEYTNHQLEIKEDRVFYLTSDGYLDQGGGSENRRFGRQRFVQMLAENSARELKEQKEIFVTRLEDYMENEEQRDDITLLGFKVDS